MGKTVIKEDMFPEIISHYNTGGRKAAYALLRERYGILHPAGVVRRIKKDGRYGYDEVKDRFEDYPACGRPFTGSARTGPCCRETRGPGKTGTGAPRGQAAPAQQVHYP